MGMQVRGCQGLGWEWRQAGSRRGYWEANRKDPYSRGNILLHILLSYNILVLQNGKVKYIVERILPNCYKYENIL